MLDSRMFTQPTAEYRPQPFWFWNSRIEEDEMLRQLRDFHEKGLGGVTIAARFGLETPYMSQEWFRLIRRCCQEARVLGMEIWLYDDADFPSGAVVLSQQYDPLFRPQFVQARQMLLTQGANILSDEEDILGAAVQDGAWQPQSLSFVEQNQNTKALEGRQGQQAAVFYRDWVKSENNAYFGVNYLNPDMTKAYMALNHEVYKRELGEFFGNPIKGFFTDEPTLLAWHQEGDWYQSGDGRVIPWDDRLPVRIAEILGAPADVPQLLTALFYPLQDEAAAATLRRAYYRAASSLYNEGFFRPYAAWCKENGLELTGHLLLEEGLYFNTIFEGDALSALMQLSVPGSDHLTTTAEQDNMSFMVGNKPHMPQERTNVTGQKLASSAAHLTGRKRVMTETFGVGGWQMNLSDMRWIAAWQYALGINMMVPHAFFYSIEGFRKTDAPPSHSHGPAFDHYRQFADMIGRLSYALSQGKPGAEVAVLYPLYAFQSVYQAGRQQPADQYISDVFDLICASLPKLHVDYEICHPDMIEPVSVTENGHLRIGDMEFSALILPSTLELPDTIAAIANEMRARGGAVLAFEPYPAHGRATQLSVDCVPPTVVAGNVGTQGIQQVLGRFLSDHQLRNVEITGQGSERVYMLCRRLPDEMLWYFANTVRTPATPDIDIPLPAGCMAVQYDVETGDVFPLTGERIANGLRIHTSLEGGASLLVGVRRELPEEPVQYRVQLPPPGSMQDAPMPMEGWRCEMDGINVCPINAFRFEIDRASMGTRYLYMTRFMVDASLLAQGPLSKDDVFLVLDDVAYRTAKMGRQELSVMLNGKEVPLNSWIIDRGHFTYPCGHLLQTGVNRITLTFRHSPWSGPPHILQQPIMLLGGFRLGRVNDAYTLFAQQKIVRLQGWEQLGYPYFTGYGRFSREVTVKRLPQRVFLGFQGDHPIADVLSVWVNGREAGTRLWAPWQVEITGLLRTGENTIALQVCNSLHNQLDCQPRPSGVLGVPVLRFSMD